MPEQVFQGDEDDRYEVSIVHGKSTLEYSLSNNEPAFPLTFWITLLLWTIVVGVNFIIRKNKSQSSHFVDFLV
jgi:hypothetical protein